jgi:hypothetical protein
MDCSKPPHCKSKSVKLAPALHSNPLSHGKREVDAHPQLNGNHAKARSNDLMPGKARHEGAQEGNVCVRVGNQKSNVQNCCYQSYCREHLVYGGDHGRGHASTQ